MGVTPGTSYLTFCVMSYNNNCPNVIMIALLHNANKHYLSV